MKPMRPVLFLVLLIVAGGGTIWMPAPTWNVPDPDAQSTVGIAVLVKAFGAPGLPLIGLGLLAGIGVGGWRSVIAGVRFLVGVEREGELLLAQRSLAAGARAMVSGGLVIGLLGGTAAFLMVREVYGHAGAPSPASLATLISWSMIAPFTALGVGRLVLATAADAAAARGGAPERRTFGRRDDLLLLLYLIPVVMAWAVVFLPARTIQ